MQIVGTCYRPPFVFSDTMARVSFRRGGRRPRGHCELRRDGRPGRRSPLPSRVASSSGTTRLPPGSPAEGKAVASRPGSAGATGGILQRCAWRRCCPKMNTLWSNYCYRLHRLNTGDCYCKNNLFPALKFLGSISLDFNLSFSCFHLRSI